MKFAAALFDLDGTVVDSAEGITAAVHAAAAELHLPAPTAQHVRASVGDGIRNLLARCFPGAPDPDALLSSYDRHYETCAGKLTRPYPGMRELLEELAPAQCALISNKAEAHCRRILDALNLSQRFASIIGGDSLSERKPSALPLLHACRTLKVPAVHALMIGDGPQDLRAARNAGMASCAVFWGFGDPAQLRSLSPRHCAGSVAELRQHLGLL